MRTIRDEYELPDEPGEDYLGQLIRKPSRKIGLGLIILALLILGIAGVYGAVRATNEQTNDSFCIGCHTPSEKTYFDRAGAAVAGALAADLSSYHYQQIRGQGGNLHCIDCHQGTGSFNHKADVLFLSARNSFTWLIGRNDPQVEKLALRVPHLANDSCTTCHQKTLLLTGMDNHQHNMLPAAYELWRNGGRLIAPPGVKDVQTVIAAGLVKYDTALVCSDCHQAHRNIETDLYLDREAVVPAKCVQCHREAGKGPLEVSVP